MSIYCSFPNLKPSTAYGKGCRCDRCKKYQKERARRYYIKNRDKCIERVTEYSKPRREEKRQYAREHYKNNKTKYVAKAKEYKVSKRNSCVLTQDEKQQIYEIYKRCREITEQTGIKHHVDHIKPISKGGLHHPDNLQILTAEENLDKSAKWDGESGK